MSRSDRLTVAHDPELDRCIKLSHHGQACWAEWRTEIRAPCSDCVYFYLTRKMHGVQMGRCVENERLLHKRTYEFPTVAKACRYFKGAGDAPQT